mgnify:CR=1 FL=1
MEGGEVVKSKPVFVIRLSLEELLRLRLAIAGIPTEYVDESLEDLLETLDRVVNEVRESLE